MGLQYTLPRLDGKMWIAANYANVSAPNAPSLVTPASGKTPSNASAVRNALNWFNLYFISELTPEIHLGVEYDYSNDRYCDGQYGINHRVLGAAYYVF